MFNIYKIWNHHWKTIYIGRIFGNQMSWPEYQTFFVDIFLYYSVQDLNTGLVKVQYLEEYVFKWSLSFKIFPITEDPLLIDCKNTSRWSWCPCRWSRCRTLAWPSGWCWPEKGDFFNLNWTRWERRPLKAPPANPRT